MVDETAVFYGGHQEINQQIMMLEEPPYIRPQSVINIVEIPDASEANPQPDNEGEKQLGEFLSAQKLKSLGGVTNLFDLQELTVKVDTTETSIGNVGAMAPNLKKLNLNNSFITTVRDLGTSLNNLNTLWLSRCCLAELDGISCISSLQELFVAYNEIFDLSPLSMLENLEVLDLEGNNIDDIAQLEFLSLCTNLTVLTMKGNPMEHSPTPTTTKQDIRYYSYREAVLSCLPHLTMLDDERFLEEIIDGKRVKRDNPKVQRSSSNSDIYVEEMQRICKGLKAIEEDLTDTSSTQSEESLSTTRPASARIRNQSARIRTSPRCSPEHTEEESFFEISELTHGRVLCGNPVQALRRRGGRQKKNTMKNKKENSIFTPEHSYLTTEEDAMDKDDIFEQLKLWRMNNKSLFGDESESPDMPDMPTSTTIINNNSSKVSAPVYSPSPPPVPKPPTSRARRPLGIERPTVTERPNTAADFRHTSDIETDLQVAELEVIDENAAMRSSDNINESNLNIPRVRTLITEQHQPARPSTARAALQTNHIVRKHKVEDVT